MFDSRRNECEISVGKSWRGKDTIYDKRWCTWWVPLRGMTCAILPRQQVYAERKVAKPWRVHRFRLLNRIKSTREVSSSVPFRWSFTSRSGSSTFSSRERNNKRNNHVFTSLELKIDGREKRCAKTHTHAHTHTHTLPWVARDQGGIEGNTDDRIHRPRSILLLRLLLDTRFILFARIGFHRPIGIPDGCKGIIGD